MKDQLDKMRGCLWLSELHRKGGVPPSVIRQILSETGSIKGLLNEKPDRFEAKISGVPEKIMQLRSFLRNKSIHNQIDMQAEAALKLNIRPVCLCDEDYPEKLRAISSSPVILYCRGDRYPEIMQSHYFVTVIGTRAPTPYGKLVTEQICSDLARQKVVVISGMARGIDSMAHRAVINHDGMTLAVVANGPDVAYPPENAGLMSEIAERGLIISEHPPGTRPLKQFFPARNRILSGLADAVAVIEASAQSGTMITAGFAGDQGKDVFAVPGSILSPFSSGCNQLIREGAEVLTDARDILWRLPVGQYQTRLEQSVRRPDEESQDKPDRNSNGSLVLLRSLSAHPMTLAEISCQLTWPLSETAVMLSGLEIEGFVQCERGRYSLTQMALCSI